MPDLSDAFRMIRELQAEVRRLRTPIQLENSSITDGRMRFIGGLLRVDSGGRVEIEGTLAIDGTTTVTGEFTVTGPWGLEGDGTITGDVTISGNVTSTGALTQNGPWNLNGAGDIAGDVDISGDVDVTGDMHVLAPGKLRVGNFLTINPTTWTDQARIGFGTTDGSAGIEGNNSRIRIWGGVNSGSIIVGSGFAGGPGVALNGAVIIDDLGPLPTGVTGKYLIRGSDGKIYTGSAGGGGGGDTPPNPFPGGYVWPADPAIYGISDDYGDHVARGSAEPGTDVMTPVGAAVYAPADGEIRAVNTSPSGATGRLVVFRASNGAWFRFLHLSQVLVTSGTVTQGALLGRTGGSGFGSESYYGPHLHITYLPGPSTTQPPLSQSTDFEVVMAGQ